MSETPRTDAEYDNALEFEFDSEDRLQDMRRFSKKLERELNAANESFRKLNIHALDLVDRIRRLEEAGDEAICPLEYAARVRIWNKAKEAKP